MGLAGDIEEGTRLWKISSWPTKILVTVSIFLSVGSIASLSEFVFKWKGFILDGLQFYRTYLTQPAIDLFAHLNVNLKVGVFDYLILIVLFLAAIIRISITSGWTKDKGYFIIFLLLFISYSVYSYIRNATSPSKVQFLVLVLGILFYPFYSKSSNRKAYSKHELFVYYMPIVLSASVVLILAAINVGLSKSA